MKHLLLIRHGRAQEAADPDEDAERRLVRKGREESVRMAAQARWHGPKPDLAVSSPAERSVETARIFCRSLGVPRLEIQMEDDLYRDASADSLLQTVRAFPESRNSAVLVGHNPSLTLFLRLLVPDFGPVFPKSGAVWLSLGTPVWKALERAGGRIVWFDFRVSPGRVKKARQHLRAEVEGRLAAAVDGVLRGFHAPAADETADAVSKACRKIAARFLENGDEAVVRFLRTVPADPRRSRPD
jgi:phosphohistidine phosphatase